MYNRVRFFNSFLLFFFAGDERCVCRDQYQYNDRTRLPRALRTWYQRYLRRHCMAWNGRWAILITSRLVAVEPLVCVVLRMWIVIWAAVCTGGVLRVQGCTVMDHFGSKCTPQFDNQENYVAKIIEEFVGLYKYCKWE